MVRNSSVSAHLPAGAEPPEIQPLTFPADNLHQPGAARDFGHEGPALPAPEFMSRMAQPRDVPREGPGGCPVALLDGADHPLMLALAESQDQAPESQQ